MVDQVLLIIAVAAGGVLALFFTAYLLVALVRVAFWLGGVGTGAVARLGDMWSETGDDLKRTARLRRVRQVLEVPKRAARPNARQLRRMHEVQQAEAGIRLLRDHMAACSLGHRVVGEVHGLAELSDLRYDPECFERRQAVDDLREVLLERLRDGALKLDPKFAQNGLFISLTRSFCGDNCHVLNCQRDEAPFPCHAVKMFGVQGEAPDACGQSN